MAKVKVFAYEGYVGIDASPDCEGIVAHPGNGNLGVVTEADKVEFSAEAVEALKRVRKSNDDLGDVDVFQAGNKVIFAWLGGYKRAFKPEDIEGSNTYDASLIKATEGIEPTDEFKTFIIGLEK